MVLSEIHPTIQYKEQKELYDDDVEMETKLYDIYFPSMRLKLTVAPGKQKHMMNNKGIVFFPIYLIHNDKFIMQIGVYELFAEELPSILDSENENEIDLGLIKRDPLLYSFSTQEELKEYGVYADDIDDIEESEPDELDDTIIKGVVGDAIGDGKIDDDKELENDESDDESDDDTNEQIHNTDTGKKRSYISVLGRKKYMSLFVDKIDHKSLPLLPEETSDEASSDKRVFKEKLSTTWIEKFMKNNNYTISKTGPDGNCFFYVIRDAYESIGKKTTVEKLRNIFSESIDEQTYMMYKEKFNMFKESYDQDTIEQKQLKEEITNSKKKYKITKDRKAQETLEKHIEEKTELLKSITDGIDTTKDILSEFQYMEKIDSLEQFKEFIKTPKCWADTLTISTMETILNIKFIILSQESYENDDKDNVVLCGQINDEISSKSTFEPSFYIITQFSGDHYDLIGYKSKFMLQFSEIPYDLKKLILMKCLEKKSGPYNLIPEFKEMKSHYDSKVVKNDVKLQSESSIFDENIVFQIYHNSSDKPFPGKGAGEKIEPDIPETRKKYAELSKIINWRRKLANTHIEPFLLKGKNWNSVEHYIQAQKFKSTPELYDQFTLESKSSISEDPIKARDAGTKKTYFKDKYKIDPTFSSKISEYLTESLEAKFSNEELKKVLLATRDAKIVSFARANTAPVMTELMQVRKSLS